MPKATRSGKLLKYDRNPRPYTQEEVRQVWQILQERGDALAQLAVAIGEEAGLQIGEVANLRLGDVNWHA